VQDPKEGHKTRNLEYISPLPGNQEVNIELEAQETSAPSGYSPGGSSQEHKSSENSDSEYIDFTGSLVNLFSQFEDLDNDLEEIEDQAPKSTPSSSKQKSTPSASNNTKMATFDVPLEYLVKSILTRYLEAQFDRSISIGSIRGLYQNL
jgi:hypothetical protein